MKKITFLLSAFIFFCVNFIFGNAPEPIIAPVTQATVFYGNGAELFHTAKVKLLAGTQEIIFTQLSTSLDVNSIQFSCPENVAIMSYQYTIVVPEEKHHPDPLVNKMKDTLKNLQTSKNNMEILLSNNNDITTRITRLIEANLANNPTKEIRSDELIKLVEYYSNKIKILQLENNQMIHKKKEIEENINSLNDRLTDIQKNSFQQNKPTSVGQIILQVNSKSIAESDFKISYFTNNAGWLPKYDVRVNTLENTLKLAYKANIFQTTGLLWDKVKLNLSTGNPHKGNNIPILSPLFIQLKDPVLYETLSAQKRLLAPTVKNVQTKDNQYFISDEGASITSGNIGQYTQTNESQLYTNYSIDLPYSIPNDGKSYSVEIKEEQLKTHLTFFSIPKLEKDAFMQSSITHWDTLNLLPAEANIIMDNTFIGKSIIDPFSTSDTLKLTLGRDKRIGIKRTLIKELSKSKIKGDTKTETFLYEIVIRNNKKQKIELLLNDQVPVSKIKEVEINIDEMSGATLQNETGLLTWTIPLKPGESKTIRFGYSVKYPKDKIFTNLR